MIQMLPEYQRIFLLRLQGKSSSDIREALGLSEEGFRDLSSREDFLQLQQILCGELVGSFEYNPSAEARRVCQELQIINTLREMIEDTKSIQDNVKLQAIKCLIDIGNWDQAKADQEKELDREVLTMSEEFLRDHAQN